MLESKIAYDDNTITIYLSNADEVCGATAIFYHKPTNEFLIGDFGIGFSSSKAGKINKDEIQPYFDLLAGGRKRSIVLTHSHRDHFIGLNEFGNYFPGTRCAMSLFSSLIVQKEFDNLNLNLDILEKTGSFQYGVFTIHYGPMVHSIPGTRSFVIEYPLATLTGKGKILFLAEGRIKESSFSPGLSQQMLDFLKKYSPYNIALIDGLRYKEAGFAEPEDVIKEPLIKILNLIPGDLFMPFISSKMALIHSIITVLKQFGYGFGAKGISMENITDLGIEKKLLPNLQFQDRELNKKMVFAVTGSQCEPGSYMHRVVNGNRSQEIIANDSIFIVQGAIPHYTQEIKWMYEKFAALNPEGMIIISKSEQKRLNLRAPNLVILEEITNIKNFALTSGHEKRDGIEEFMKIASAEHSILYQHNEENYEETGVLEQPEEENKMPLVELARQYIKNRQLSAD